jgi:hypothetical protein
VVWLEAFDYRRPQRSGHTGTLAVPFRDQSLMSACFLHSLDTGPRVLVGKHGRRKQCEAKPERRMRRDCVFLCSHLSQAFLIPPVFREDSPTPSISTVRINVVVANISMKRPWTSETLSASLRLIVDGPGSRPERMNAAAIPPTNWETETTGGCQLGVWRPRRPICPAQTHGKT